MDYDITKDYGLFFPKLPVTIPMYGPREDITENTEDDLQDLPLPVRTIALRGQHFLPGPRHAGPSRHYRHGSGDEN